MKNYKDLIESNNSITTTSSSSSSCTSSSGSCSNCGNNKNKDGNCGNCPNTNKDIMNINNKNFKNILNNNNNSNIFYSKNKNTRNHIAICNKITIDVAVLCQEYTTIEKMCDDHIINLDEIEITKDLFQCIFYPYYENFGINKNTVCNNCSYAEYISFLPEYRTVNGKKFYLLEEIISNIESDLNISRNCFTVESLVELTNEIISINSLCDLNCCSVLSSLTWCNILEIIKNYSIINENCGCAPIPSVSSNASVSSSASTSVSSSASTSVSSSSSTSTSSSSSSSTSVGSGYAKEPIIPICVISVIFKTPTPGVKNTIVRFNYRITDF
jgi:hypothetical protein